MSRDTKRRALAGMLIVSIALVTAWTSVHPTNQRPHRISSGIKTILPEYSDEVAYKLGLIDTDLDLARMRARFRINDRARQFAQDSLFSFRIRELPTASPTQ